jgi:inner membrane protease subunit 1
MAHRALNVRYLAAKVAASVEEVLTQMQNSAHTSFSDALAKGMERFHKQMTSVGVLTGIAMSPTLNSSGLTEPGAVESFLLRLIPRPKAYRTIFDGDVVALNSPLSGPRDAHHVIVRRVAALEGDEMVSDDPECEPFRIPKDHAWVLADNETLEPKEAIDSRVFGPIPMQSILGRVIYAAHSATNHGYVENSIDAMELDAPVLEAELDMDRLLHNNGDSSSSSDDNS